MTASLRTGIYFKLVLMALFWGGTFVAGRMATAEIPPATAALWRFGLAALSLVVVVYAVEGGLPRLDGREWKAVLLLGFTGVFIFSLCFMYGLARVPASRGSLIMALNPAVTLLASAAIFRERLTRNKVAGVAIALFGVLVVLGRGDLAHLFSGGIGAGEIILFGCPISWAIYTLAARHLLPNRSPLAVTAYACLTGSGMLVVATTFIGGLVPPAASWQAWSAVVFTGLFGTAVALVWFYQGVRALGPARTAVFINLVPVFAIALGVMLLGEALEASMLIGGAIVIAGIYLLNRPERTRAVPAPAE